MPAAMAPARARRTSRSTTSSGWCARANRVSVSRRCPTIWSRTIIGQRRDTETLLARAHQPEDVVDLEVRLARAGAIAAGIDQPAAILQLRRDLSVAQHDDA